MEAWHPAPLVPLHASNHLSGTPAQGIVLLMPHYICIAATT